MSWPVEGRLDVVKAADGMVSTKLLGSEDFFPPFGVPYGAPAHNALSSAKINGGGILIFKLC